MNSYEALNENSYRIGRVTIDLSLHTQSADEAFFHYFGNDVLYSIKRTVHEDDREHFIGKVASVGKSETIKTVIRMKGCRDDYRYMLASMTYNSLLSDNEKTFIDISLHDIFSLERLIYATEYKVTEYRFLLSMFKNLAFEYSFETKRIKIYFFELYRDMIIADEEIDTWRNSVIENKFIDSSFIPVFDDLCSDIKNGVYRFEYEIDSSIFSFGKKKEFSLISGVTYHDDIEHRKVMGTISMISPKNRTKEINSAIEYNKDSLTQLMNRSAVINYARRCISHSLPDNNISIVILNLDNFRTVNETYGHILGDEVLYQTGRIIKNEIGSRGVSGRIGGDEFMLVIEGIIDEVDLRGILRAIRTKIEWSFADRNIKITCSMGISSYSKDSMEYDEIFALSNLALKIAKKKGGNRYVIYDREKHGSLSDYTTKDRYHESKVNFVSSICERIFTLSGPVSNDIFSQTAEIFELDNIQIYYGSDMKNIYSLIDINRNDAKYFLSGNYQENFSNDDVFAIDNINMLEGRSQNAYLYFTENNILGAVQCLIRNGDEIQGMISYELNGHFKKWSDIDISYLTIISRAAASNIIKNNNKNFY